jgi:hypothetical protein
MVVRQHNQACLPTLLCVTAVGGALGSTLAHDLACFKPGAQQHPDGYSSQLAGAWVTHRVASSRHRSRLSHHQQHVAVPSWCRTAARAAAAAELLDHGSFGFQRAGYTTLYIAAYSPSRSCLLLSMLHAVPATADIVRNFKELVDEKLPGMYTWFDERSLHVTVRAIIS